MRRRAWSVMSIDHLYIESPSFDASVALWESLGFRVEDPRDEGDPGPCRFGSGRAAIVLAESGTPLITILLAIDSLDALTDRVATDAGVRVETPPEPMHWGTRWLHVRDADGRSVALEEVDPANRWP